MAGPAPFRQSAAATADAVPRLRGAVERYLLEAGVADELVTSVILSLSEALSNVVLHAYPEGDAPGPVHVDATLGAASLEVVVADEGRGMAPRLDSPGAGLGLPIIAKLATTVEIAHEGERGTRLTLSFALGPA
jgi:serine/threonine-protein kinase RsbW/stage II sporulation protein AB (anti-sigma F factor)